MSARTRSGRPALAHRLRPSLDDLVDAVFLLVLGVLALVGFSTAFGGSRPVTAGLLGLLLGIVCAYVGVQLRLSAAPMALSGVAVFFLLGGVVAVRSTTAGGGIPTLETLRALVDGAVHGWARLVTTVPPTGEYGNVVVVPFLCGLACGLTGYALARRLRASWPPILPPVAVLGLSILLGTLEPASVLLQGAAFAVALLLWVSLRSRRGITVVAGVSPVARIVGAVAMLTLVAVGAILLGPRLPLANANERLVLRDHVDPPFDPRDYESPLLRMRKYVSEEKAKVIFTATGLPAGARIRLAVMDDYDGAVWNVAGGTSGRPGASGYFERVGADIPPADGAPPTAGTPVDVTFTVGDYAGVWVPGVGTASAVSFGGPHSADLAASFRYNRATGQGVVPSGLAKGDVITEKVVVPTPVAPDQLSGRAAGSDMPPEPLNVPASMREKLTDLVGEATDAGSKIATVGAALQEQGYFSQGEPQQGGYLLPGHSSFRLDQFFAGDALLGDGEQYAAAAALIARALNVPARVVMGWSPTTTGTFEATGANTTAWIEAEFDGLGWVPVDVTPDHEKLLTQETTKPKPQPQPDVPVPPQTKIDLTPPVAAPADEVTDDKDAPPPSDSGSLLRTIALVTAVVGIPLVLVLVPLLAIVAAKARRRRRRQSAGDPTARIAGGWDEVVDRAQDRGLDLPPNGTRVETAGDLGGGAVAVLARGADAASFSLEAPTDADAAAYWEQVRQVTRAGRSGLGPWSRFHAAVSLRSSRIRKEQRRAARRAHEDRERRARRSRKKGR